MIRKYKKPVHLTFNSLYYIPEQYPEIVNIIIRCMSIGFNSFIVADPALLLYLRQSRINCEIHLSGETAEVNSGMIKYFEKKNLKRLIFHRKNSIEDMNSIINKAGNLTEFEAFTLNEMCQFTGAFCNSLHCDEMCHLCLVPMNWDGSEKVYQQKVWMKMWTNQKMTAIFVDRLAVASALYTSWKKLVLLI